MDEAEKYQQRLQVIEEKRRQQEEEERIKREKEEEWLKLAQRQRKSLRDQWLSECAPPVPVPPPASQDAPEPQQDQSGEHPGREHTGIHNSTEEEEEGWEVLKVTVKEEQARHAGGLSIHCGESRAQSYSQAIAEEEALLQVIGAAEGQLLEEMAQKMFLSANGQDDRSVLGMVAVQVERDPKTGATVVRSVTPVSAPEGAAAAAAMTTTVFDDGRKSVHAIGGAGAQPSAQELGQILSAIDGVGMRVLLDEVAVAPPRGDGGQGAVGGAQPVTALEEGDAEGGRGLSDGSMLHGPRAEITGCPGSGGEEMKDDGAMIDKRSRVDVEDGEAGFPLESGPVTLTFLGYADAHGQGVGRQDNGALLTVERVIIADGGEEEEASFVSQAGLQEGLGADGHQAAETPGVTEGEAAGGAVGIRDQARASFQEVPLEANEAGVRAQGGEPTAGVEEDLRVLPCQKREGHPKRKTCQCCSVM